MKFLNDLYRDLRDRSLLPVAIGLVVAIVAVPVLLSSSPEAEEAGGGPSPSAAQTAAELALETQPVVALESPRLRETRRRLREFRSKNPFKQQFVQPPPEVKEVVKELEKAFKEAAGKLGEQPIGPQPPAGPPQPGEPGFKAFTHRIDVRFGEAGETKLRRNVRTLSLLPSDFSPVVSFLGVTESERSAVFLVSADVGAQGEGRCRPSVERCTFLTMKAGETEFLDVGAGTDDHVTYEMKLVKIRRFFFKSESAQASGAEGERRRESPAAEPATTGDTRPEPVGEGTARSRTRREPASLSGWLQLGF